MSNPIGLRFKKLFDKKFARFFAVGVWNTIVDLGVLTLLVKLFDIQADQTLRIILANTVSGSCSIASSFILNRLVVFRDKGNPIKGKKMAIFVGVSLIGAYGINNTVLNLVILHADWLHNIVYSSVEFIRLDGVFSQNFVKIFTGKAIAGLCSMFWSFWAYGKFVFDKRD